MMQTAIAATSEHSPAFRTSRVRNFYRGYHTFHTEEIDVGRSLHSALMLIHGADKAQRLLRDDAASVFRPLRYGRRWFNVSPAVCLMVDRGPFFQGKADNDSILIPGRRGWKQFRDQVHAISIMPRWAGGFSAAAEALNDAGYAIAESVAAMLCWGIEDDDGINFWKM